MSDNLFFFVFFGSLLGILLLVVAVEPEKSIEKLEAKIHIIDGKAYQCRMEELRAVPKQ